jgi:hypothetical protein
MKILPMISAHVRAPVGGSLASANVDRVEDDGTVHVAIGDAPAVPARLAAMPGVPLGALTPGTQVLVLLEPDRDEAPVIVSTIVARIPEPPVVLELHAQQQLVLRCGDASISIGADGTIEIRGERIDSEAEGIQRIKGAQVRIN